MATDTLALAGVDPAECTGPASYAEAPADYGLTVDVVLVTPGLAAAWLARNARHRKIKPKLVEKYVAQMRAGQWELNGKTLVFDRDGVLLGGQHRLTACVESGCSFRVLVVRGVDSSTLVRE